MYLNPTVFFFLIYIFKLICYMELLKIKNHKIRHVKQKNKSNI